MDDSIAGSQTSSTSQPTLPTAPSPSSSPQSPTIVNLQWLIALVPVVGAIVLYTCLRIRNARNRLKELEEGTLERRTMTAPHPGTSMENDDTQTTVTITPPPSFTAHTLGRDRRGRLRIPARPLLQFPSSSPLRTQRSNSSLFSSTSSLWRRFQQHNSTEDELDRRRRRSRRRRRRQRPPRTPPPMYPGSPPPKYEDVIRSERNEPSTNVQTRLSAEEHQQTENEPLVHLQQRLAATDIGNRDEIP
ncbi:hypothetical protein EC973_009185 [Apophysomyces ossiformis]|uniref:Transmembrane protein n=1 Tax=Apophysomyces ossiformis TaxID=679940 RepID=A0A8H7BSC6_9FUNG|nr:hypothetical protein EC973_009185 [Apophysomyces ossiformis]